jgi:hypothetical protein
MGEVDRNECLKARWWMTLPVVSYTLDGIIPSNPSLLWAAFSYDLVLALVDRTTTILFIPTGTGTATMQRETRMKTKNHYCVIVEKL